MIIAYLLICSLFLLLNTSTVCCCFVVVFLCFYLFLCGFFFGFCVCLSAVPALSGALSGLKIRSVCAWFLVLFFPFGFARSTRCSRSLC